MDLLEDVRVRSAAACGMHGLCLVVALVVGPPLVAGGDGRASRDDLVREALAALHEGRFEDALRTTASLREIYPEDPAGALGAANVYQTMMRDYRVRAFEREFTASQAEARALSERQHDRHPTADAVFARGTARMYKALHRFTRGEWVGAFLDAVAGMSDMRRAAELDATFVDPLLAMAVHDYWKAERLGLGVGLFSGGRKRAVERLQVVQAKGRFLRVEASYALQTILYKDGRLVPALALNDALLARFPGNPVALYHRGLILEGLSRRGEALAAWEALVTRLQSFPHQSDGFLAECHLHRAQLLEASGRIAESRVALALAKTSICRRDAARELEGPLTSVERVRNAVNGLARMQVPPLTCGAR